MLMLISCGKASSEKESQYKVAPVEDEIEDPVTVTPSPTEKAAKPSKADPTAKPSADGSAAQPSGDGSMTSAPSGEDAATVTPDQGADEVAAPSEQDYTGPLEGEPDTDF